MGVVAFQAAAIVAAAAVVPVAPLLAASVTSFPTGEPPSPLSAAWRPWFNTLVQHRLDEAPLARPVTFHFSQQGDDAAGDGSPARPFRTLAKAQAILDSGLHPAGLALLFRRGDTWRETAGLRVARAAVTIADWGAGPKPLLSAFQPVDPAGWRPAPGLPSTFVRDEPAPVTWLRETDDHNRPYARVATPAAVSALPGSWHWDPAGLLYVRPFPLAGAAPFAPPTDPRTDAKPYQLVRPTGSGLLVTGDAARLENIAAEGWGMARFSPTQQHGIDIRVEGGHRAVVVACESHYGSSHAMTHYAQQGGIVTFIDCRAGLCNFNAYGETVFNAYTVLGGSQVIFLRCTATHGTLPSSDWNWPADRRAGAFYAHTSQFDGAPFAFVAAVDCASLPGPFSCGSAANFLSLPPAPSPAFVRGLIVGERFDAGGASAQLAIAPQSALRIGGAYLGIRPAQGNVALANWAQRGFIVNCHVELDLSDYNGPFALYNGPAAAPSTPAVWHSRVDVRAGPRAEFRIDFDTPHQSAGAQFINSIFIFTGPGSERLLADGPPVLFLGNALHGVDLPPFAEAAANPRLQPPPPATPPALPITTPELLAAWHGPGAPPPIGLDLLGPVPLRATIGPVELSPAADLTADGLLTIEDLYAAHAPPPAAPAVRTVTEQVLRAAELARRPRER